MKGGCESGSESKSRLFGSLVVCGVGQREGREAFERSSEGREPEGFGSD